MVEISLGTPSVGWLLVLDLKEGLVECATVCVKSVVILLQSDMEPNFGETTKDNIFLKLSIEN